MSIFTPFRPALVLRTAIFATVFFCFGYTMSALHGSAKHPTLVHVELCEAPPEAI